MKDAAMTQAANDTAPYTIKAWRMSKAGRSPWIAYYAHVMSDAVRDGWHAQEIYIGR